ncbi:MAG: hypothetical protein KC413_10550, partial [Anaerolineales bacterium]|nr:hypothetical protein [Anaerolineales bacterium]
MNEIPSGLWLLSAPKGAGKTTFCGSVIDAMRTGGASVGGILCPAVFAEGEKVGIDQVHIATGERRRLGVRAGGGPGRRNLRRARQRLRRPGR